MVLYQAITLVLFARLLVGRATTGRARQKNKQGLSCFEFKFG
jgi:hypothetical protein